MTVATTPSEPARIWRFFIGREDEFWDYVDTRKDDECWPAKRSLNYRGYLRIRRRWTDGGNWHVMGHRVAKILTDGYSPDPKLTCIDHLCRNTRCCNPAHLEWTTLAENTKRQQQALDVKLKRPCQSGQHVLWGANIVTDTDGSKQCRSCQKEASYE